jgi:hypothetical protein
LSDGLLFSGWIEIRQIEDAMEPRIAPVGEKPFGVLSKKRLQGERPRRTFSQQPRAYQRIFGEEI